MLVTGIMPTTAKRKAFIPDAIEGFLGQTYQNTELVIVTEDDLSDVIPAHPAIRVISCQPRASIGVKRDIACEAARGTVVATFDDDDRYYSDRLTECMAVFEQNPDVQVVGYQTILYLETRTGIYRKYTFGPWRHMAHGTSLMYRKSFWETRRFGDVRSGEDTRFQRGLLPSQIITLDGEHKCVARDWGGNTCNRLYTNEGWEMVRPDHSIIDAFAKP